MYYLDKKQFLPEIIAVSALLLPVIVALTIAFFLCLETKFLIILCAFVLTYVAIALFLWQNSRREMFFLELTETEARIVYEDLVKGKTELHLSFQDIHTLTYYKITSPKAWLMTLLAYCVPQSVYLKYTDGKETCERLIGYLDYDAVQEIATITKSNLKVY